MKSPVVLSASQDAAGDGWIELWLSHHHAVEPFTGFHLKALTACVDGQPCADVSVFGGAGGEAEASGMLVSAGYAFVNGVVGACLAPLCAPIHPPSASAPPKLITSLSVAFPIAPGPSTRVRACIEGGLLHGGQGYELAHGICSEVALGRGSGPLNTTMIAAAGGMPKSWASRRGVALVKTYKTGSSTLGSLLHRYADARALDVAVNAKALRHVRSLEPRLRPGTMPKPTECLYEFHTFKPCGQDWLGAQERSVASTARLAPKPLQLVIDHSRWQPLDELLEPRGARTPTRLPGGAACEQFVQRMRDAGGVAHRLFTGADRSSIALQLRSCVGEVAKAQVRGDARGSGTLRAPSAYRETTPGALLVTLMRWPPSRFTSAVEQFDMPQQTGVPCKRNRRRSGGRCYGQTCERDFKFTWQCMNQTVHRFGMLATFVRCLMDPSAPDEQAAHRLSDLDEMARLYGEPPIGGDLARARDDLTRRLTPLAAGHRGHRSDPTPSTARGRASQRNVPPLAGCIQRRRPNHELPNSFRFVQESVANTLGWPLHPAPRVDNWRRMLSGGGTANGAIKFAKLALDWLAVLSRSLDVVLISEHYDESLLLLSRRLSVSPLELVYISQKRRAQSSMAARGAAHTTSHAPAAQAAMSVTALPNVSVWPDASLLRDPEGPWLWPNELDTTLRTNWLDSLSYLYFNASLWTQLDTLWPGEAGRAQMAHELQRFRETRKAIVASCDACESIGAQACLAAARASAHVAPPHLCWSLRQDTRSWSEHFFQRMALRFDAAAAAATSADTTTASAGQAVGGPGSAGLRTGNVHWWRCPRTRAVTPRCSRPSRAPGAAVTRYSLWDCGVCAFA